MAANSNQEPGWYSAGTLDDLTSGNAKEVVIDGQIIALFREGDTIHAMDGMCAHQGGPIAEGQVQHGCVTCPWHGWQYELDTGIQTVNRQPLQKIFSTRTVGNVIEGRIEPH